MKYSEKFTSIWIEIQTIRTRNREDILPRSPRSHLGLFLLVSVSLSATEIDARQFAPKQQPAPTTASDATAPQDGSTTQIPLYTGASDKNLKVSIVKVVYADNKDEFLPKDQNWAQLTVALENIRKSAIKFDSVKVKQNSGVLFNSASSTAQLAKAPDTMAEVGKAGGIVAAGQFAGAFIFPPLALVSSALAMFGLGNSTRKWAKQTEAIEASALAADIIPANSIVSGNVYLPAVADQKELVFIYSIDGKVSELAVPVSGYRTIELKTKKKRSR